MQDFTIMFVVGSFAAANKNSAVLMLSSNSLLAEIIHQLWDKIHTKKVCIYAKRAYAKLH